MWQGEALSVQKVQGETIAEQEQFEKVSNVIDYYNAQPDSLIQVLHVAQEVFGCLPMNVQEFIAERMNMPLSRVTGVVSFYSFFSTEPRGKHTIRVCLGTACYVRGGKKLIGALEERLGIKLGETTPDRLFTFEVARCIGSCGLAPAMMIDDQVYKQVNVNRLNGILAHYAEEANQ